MYLNKKRKKSIGYNKIERVKKVISHLKSKM